MKDMDYAFYLFMHVVNTGRLGIKLLNLVGMQNMSGQVRNTSMNREAGVQA